MDNDKVNRRGALKIAAGVAGATACAGVIAPGLKMIAAPAQAGGASGKWVRTVKLDALAEGAPKKVAIRADARDGFIVDKDKELGAVWLIRRGNQVECFSATCPHLGCSIGYDAQAAFFCPCHDSAFGVDGARQKGPSPRALDKLATKLDADGTVLVDFRRYRQGTPEAIEIG
jgi:cytochrome b6-f complex iron-sulfur subunit/menaquinol-cytochrome c reductase iron-sulfur subunit